MLGANRPKSLVQYILKRKVFFLFLQSFGLYLVL